MAEASFGNTTIPRPATQPAASSSQPPNRVHFASAGAVRRHLSSAAVKLASETGDPQDEIERLLPKAETGEQWAHICALEAQSIAKTAHRSQTARELATDIVGAHTHLIGRLAVVPPNVIHPFLNADEDDLQLRAETLRCNLRAVAAYVIAFLRDTDSSTNAMQIDRRWLDGLFDDLIGDACGPIESAAERMREERANRAA